MLMDPFILHSACRNALRIPRIIINPPVLLKEPFNFDCQNPDDYSLVERKTLKELGVDSLPGWKITGEEKVVPERVRIQAETRVQELKRSTVELKDGTSNDGPEKWETRLPTPSEILSMKYEYIVGTVVDP